MAPCDEASILTIPLTRPIIDLDEVLPDFRTIFASGQLTSGVYLERFEAAVAAFVGTKHGVATTSATTALHLSLVAHGIGNGDEVLVSDFTFPASANAVVQCGATPVFVDCCQNGFNTDIEDAAAKVTRRTRAFLLVDPFGQPAALEDASELARREGLVLLEDAACALGSSTSGRRCGSWPGVGCFSFHPRKIITCGEGGMITTDSDEISERARRLRSHGGVRQSVGVRFIEAGYNYRLSELQAAMGLAQVRRLTDLLGKRRHAAAVYSAELAGCGEVALPGATSPGANFQSFVVLLASSVDRDATVAALRARGIESTLGTYAMHAQPAYAELGYAPGQLPHSLHAQSQSLTLPLWPGMPDETIIEVAEALRTILDS